jgi:hypothetical protein
MAETPIITKSPRFVDLTGRRCGSWTVLSHSHLQDKVRYWNCRCDCGVERIVNGNNLRKGVSAGCGCARVSTRIALNKAQAKEVRVNDHPLYPIWLAIRQRCYNKKHKHYAGYGGRGITMCDRWRLSRNGRSGFYAFVEDMGPRPDGGYSIERLDNNGNYSPDNCEWRTQKEQCVNRRNNRIVEFKGQKMAMIQAIEASGLTAWTVYQRLQRGWDVDRALSTPARR